MRTRAARRLLGIGVVAAVAVVGWRAVGTRGAATDDPSLIEDRVWVEKRPDKHTDYVHVMMLFSRAHVGIFERASSYDIHLELADYRREEGAVKLVFPQTGQTKDFTAKVSSCDAMPPFDLCLDVSENPWGGPKRYYGFREEEDERAALGALAVETRARAASPGE